MNNLDCWFNILIHANYKTSLILLQTCTYLANYPNIWKLKCQAQYPNKPYFDFWTGKENYLVCCFKKFSLAVNFSNYHDVSKYLYEYSPVLKHVLNLSSEIINENRGYSAYEMITFKVKNQFIVAKQDYDYRISLFGQYKSNTEALDNIKNDQELMIADAPDPDYNFSYVIINLEKLVPYFLKLGKFRSTHGIYSGSFYIGSVNDPIEFK